MSDTMKIGFRLFVITLIAAICMGLTNMATEEPIRQQHIRIAKESKQAALPQAMEFSELDIIPGPSNNDTAEILEINAGKSSDDIVGYIFKVRAMGFGGDIEIIVGINSKDEIEAIQIGEHGETPGLGANIKEKYFTDQYHGKGIETPLTVNKSQAGDQEIQAITGATVTSDAVTNGVNLATQYYREVLQNGGAQ